MENTTVDGKYLRKLTLTYTLIIIIVNLIGNLMATSSALPSMETDNYRVWLEFLEKNKAITTGLSILSFIVPAVLIVIYRISMRKKTDAYVIHMPFIYSGFGCLGWSISYFTELGCLFYVNHNYHIKIVDIAFISLLNILQESICIFTLSYLILNFVHRKFVLPKLFPEGKIGSYTGGVKPSVRFLVIVFYLSVCIFPVFFMTSSLVNIIRNNHIAVNVGLFVILGVVLFFSVIIVWTFCDYFTDPLAKLKVGVKEIKAGDYNCHVEIVRSDEFGELADAFNDMVDELDEKSKRIQAIQNSIIKGMAVMVESRDNSTGGHISRTSDCVKVFMEKLVKTELGKNLSPSFCEAVIKAAPMHDLGKIAVDDAILRKPGRFTDEEYEKMKAHSAEGARIVRSVLAQVDNEEFKKIAVNVAHYHHEKWNGEGYPEKISKEEIPLEARIMALADVFDALVSKRCYKDSYTYDSAFQIIEESLGTHFDPELGKVFIGCRAELETLYNGYGSQEEEQ